MMLNANKGTVKDFQAALAKSCISMSIKVDELQKRDVYDVFTDYGFYKNKWSQATQRVIDTARFNHGFSNLQNLIEVYKELCNVSQNDNCTICERFGCVAVITISGTYQYELRYWILDWNNEKHFLFLELQAKNANYFKAINEFLPCRCGNGTKLNNINFGNTEWLKPDQRILAVTRRIPYADLQGHKIKEILRRIDLINAGKANEYEYKEA